MGEMDREKFTDRLKYRVVDEIQDQAIQEVVGVAGEISREILTPLVRFIKWFLITLPLIPIHKLICWNERRIENKSWQRDVSVELLNKLLNRENVDLVVFAGLNTEKTHDGKHHYLYTKGFYNYFRNPENYNSLIQKLYENKIDRDKNNHIWMRCWRNEKYLSDDFNHTQMSFYENYKGIYYTHHNNKFLIFLFENIETMDTFSEKDKLEVGQLLDKL